MSLTAVQLYIFIIRNYPPKDGKFSIFTNIFYYLMLPSMDLLSVRHKQISVHIFYSFYYNSNKFPGDIFLIFLRFCLSIFFA